jgi:hypothetical protein
MATKRTLVKKEMAAIADQVFRAAFNQMINLAAKRGTPATVGAFMRAYLGAMRDCLREHERRDPMKPAVSRLILKELRTRAQNAA